MKLENKITAIVGSLLVLPYNIGLIILTGVIWTFALYLPYYNTNFDLISAMSGNMVFFSGGCVLASLLMPKREEAQQIGFIAIVSFILSIVTLPITKSVALNTFGSVVLYPLNIFCLLLLVKNIWLSLAAVKKS